MPRHLKAGLKENAEILQETKSNIAMSYKKLGEEEQKRFKSMVSGDSELQEWIEARRELESRTDALTKHAAAGPEEYKEAVAELKGIIDNNQKIQAQILQRIEEHLQMIGKEGSEKTGSVIPKKVKYKGATYIKADDVPTKADYILDSVGKKIQNGSLEQLAYDAVEVARAEGDEQLAKKAEIVRLALAVADGIANYRYSSVPENAKALSTLVQEYFSPQAPR